MDENNIKDHCRNCGEHKDAHHWSTGQCPQVKVKSRAKEGEPPEFTFTTYMEKNPFLEAAPHLYKALKAILPYAKDELAFLQGEMEDLTSGNHTEEMNLHLASHIPQKMKSLEKAINAIEAAERALKIVEYNLPAKLPDGRFNS